MSVFFFFYITRYDYNHPVRESVSQIKIYPLVTKTQVSLGHEIAISESPEVQVFDDYFGNRTGWFSIEQPVQNLTIDSRLSVRTLPPAPVHSEVADWDVLWHRRFKQYADYYNQFRLIDLSKPETLRSKSRLEAILEEIFSHRDAPAAFVQRCSEYIFHHFNYQKGITTVETTVDEILDHQSGVCQDFAHVLLEMLRLKGIPARYVSGYICPNRDGVRGAGATHAWVEAWLPQTGWRGIDPTNNVWVSDHHVALATGRNFSDSTPVKGTFKGTAQQHLSVYVSVGLEDGTTFEDSNDVQMQSFAPAGTKAEVGGGQ